MLKRKSVIIDRNNLVQYLLDKFFYDIVSTGSNSSMGTLARGPGESNGGGGGPMRRRVSDKCTLPISAGTNLKDLPVNCTKMDQDINENNYEIETEKTTVF